MGFTYAIVMAKVADLGSNAAQGSLVVELSETISDGTEQFAASGQLIEPFDAYGAAAICLPSNVGVNPNNTYYSMGLDAQGSTFKPVAYVIPKVGLIPLDIGSGAPSSGTGANGDWYLDQVAQVVYGPKAGGIWPAVGTSVSGIGATPPAGVVPLAVLPPALVGAPLISYVLATSVGQPFGVPPLDENGQIPVEYLDNVDIELDATGTGLAVISTGSGTFAWGAPLNGGTP